MSPPALRHQGVRYHTCRIWGCSWVWAWQPNATLSQRVSLYLSPLLCRAKIAELEKDLAALRAVAPEQLQAEVESLRTQVETLAKTSTAATSRCAVSSCIAERLPPIHPWMHGCMGPLACQAGNW